MSSFGPHQYETANCNNGISGKVLFSIDISKNLTSCILVA